MPRHLQRTGDLDLSPTRFSHPPRDVHGPLHPERHDQREGQSPARFDALAGFGVTFKAMFSRPVTEQYPEEPGPVAKRYHGRHKLNRYADG
ncbi:MAG: hypothetical protein ABJB33_04500, partial [Gemmatimonadota bacterium]